MLLSMQTSVLSATALLAPVLGAQLQFHQYANRVSPVPAASVFAVAVVDLDGDGDGDAVWVEGSASADAVVVRLNDGNGVFAAGFETPLTGGIVAALDHGDVDGDGDVDVVLASSGSALLLNDGTGRLSPSGGLRLPFGLSSDVTLADLDGDGDLDAAFARSGNAQNLLFLNDGNGRFRDATPRLPADDDQTEAVAARDIDGDGDLDLLFANSGTSMAPQGVALYLNSGRAEFSPAGPGQLPQRPVLAYSLVVTDFDGDGDPDLYVGGGGFFGDALFCNDGAGVFSDCSARLTLPLHHVAKAIAVDVDLDGDPDVVGLTNTPLSPTFLAINDGTGALRDATGRMLAPVMLAADLAAADLDGDRDQDLFIGARGFTGNQPVRPWFNQHRHVQIAGTPSIGGVLDLRIGVEPGYAPLFRVAIPLLAVAEQTTATPFGRLGLELRTLVPLAPLTVVPSTGVPARVTVAIPADPRLVGQTVAAQALILDPAGSGHLTNVWVATVQ